MAGQMNYSEKYFTLKNGAKMPAVGMGTMGITKYRDMYNALDSALESGYRLFDTAGLYGNEKLIRNAFRRLLPKHGLVREEVFITTKLAPDSNDARAVVHSFEESLEKLGMEYIDMFLLQYPSIPGIHPKSSRNAKMRYDVWKAITSLYEKSKIRAIGVSNFNIRHLRQLNETVPVGPMVIQIEWHPYNYQLEMLKYCSENKIQIQAYNSFGGLSRNNKDLIQDPVVEDIALRYDVTPAQVLLLWALQKDVAVIPKSTEPEHLRDNRQLNFRIYKEDESLLDALGAKKRKYSYDPSPVF